MPRTTVKARATVKWYDARKGYGYATRKGHDEVFFHYGAIITDGVIELKPGQEIEFEMEQTPRGAIAHAVRVGSRS